MIREVTYSNPITTAPVEIKVTHELNKLPEQEWTIKIDNNKKNLWETVKLLIKASPFVLQITYQTLKLIIYIQSIKDTLMDKDKLSTLLGFVANMIISIAGWLAPDYLKGIDELMKSLIPWIIQTIALVNMILAIFAFKKPKETK